MFHAKHLFFLCSSVMFMFASPFKLFAADESARLNPSLPPSANFDLRRWALTLPLPIGGVGNAKQIETSVLNAGYTKAPYFYTGSTGSMNFWAPDNGATTKDATHPRSELLEEWNGNGSVWTISEFTNSTLTVSMLISQVPKTGLIVIGQVHGNGVTDKYGNKVVTRPLLKVMYSSNPKDPKGNACNGCIYAQIRPTAASPEDGQTDYTLATNIKLNQKFRYSIDMQYDGTMTITVNNRAYAYKVNTSKNNTIGWGAQGFYFKAGAYVLDHGTSGTDGGGVDIYALSVKHQV